MDLIRCLPTDVLRELVPFLGFGDLINTKQCSALLELVVNLEQPHLGKLAQCLAQCNTTPADIEALDVSEVARIVRFSSSLPPEHRILFFRAAMRSVPPSAWLAQPDAGPDAELPSDIPTFACAVPPRERLVWSATGGGAPGQEALEENSFNFIRVDASPYLILFRFELKACRDQDLWEGVEDGAWREYSWNSPTIEISIEEVRDARTGEPLQGFYSCDAKVVIETTGREGDEPFLTLHESSVSFVDGRLDAASFTNSTERDQLPSEMSADPRARGRLLNEGAIVNFAILLSNEKFSLTQRTVEIGM